MTALRTSKVAVSVAFIANGLAFSSWLSRGPAIRADLGLTNAGYGLLLLCLSAAAISALPLSGPLVHRVGPARTVGIGTAAVVAGMLVLAAGLSVRQLPLAAAGLVLNGLGTSIWDVAQNVEGADVERRLAHTLMPRLHAGFSLGTIAGAGLGAACAGLGVSVAMQLVLTAALVTVVMVPSVRRFLPVTAEVREARTGSSGVLTAWREPRTLLIGVIMLGFGFTEGTANDWLAIAAVDGYGVSDAVGAVVFGVFVTGMTLARTLAGTSLERFGRVAVLRVTAVAALTGLLLVVFGGSLWLAVVGTALWGIGASLGFPVGMSAAADDPVRAAVRVSVASSIGYAAFIAGPPLIGFLARRVGVLDALLVVFGALLLGLLASRAVRPLPERTEPAEVSAP